MKIIKPKELNNPKSNFYRRTQVFKENTVRIIDEFNYAVSTSKFHYLSTEKEKCIFYPADADYCNKYSFAEAIRLITGEGWNVDYKIRTSAHGWFNSIVIHL